MDHSAASWQSAINIGAGVAVFFGGWLLKIIFGLMSKMQDDYKELNKRTEENYKKISQDLTGLALSIPEKYVSKDDFNQLVKAVHHRFDRLEEKLDQMKK
jgi:tetrahydromethanopterin S-methyltransferase subunit G